MTFSTSSNSLFDDNLSWDEFNAAVESISSNNYTRPSGGDNGDFPIMSSSPQSVVWTPMEVGENDVRNSLPELRRNNALPPLAIPAPVVRRGREWYEANVNRQSKSRNWVLTWYGFSDTWQEDIKAFTHVKYAILGKEVCPTTGRLHLQCFFIMDNTVRWNHFNNFFAGQAWWEPMSAKATSKQNYDYCSKGHDFIEIGMDPIFVGYLSFRFRTAHRSFLCN
jgi:hypothetical protein